MKILVGTTELEVTSCSPFRNDNGKIELKVVVPADGQNEAELRALFKNNTEDILKYADDGVTVIETLSGFRFTVNTAYEEKINSFKIFAEGISEAEFQNGRLRQQIADQNKTISQMQNTVDTQSAEILAQAEVIVAQGETIVAQNEQVAALMEASTSQLDAIDSIMTEVIPLVAQEAASIAVEQALAAIAETETTVEETTEEE